MLIFRLDIKNIKGAFFRHSVYYLMINIAHADNVKMIRMMIIEVDYTVYCI